MCVSLRDTLPTAPASERSGQTKALLLAQTCPSHKARNDAVSLQTLLPLVSTVPQWEALEPAAEAAAASVAAGKACENLSGGMAGAS